MGSILWLGKRSQDAHWSQGNESHAGPPEPMPSLPVTLLNMWNEDPLALIAMVHRP